MTRQEATTRKLLAGGLAGAVSKSAVAPLERLTTIMMSDATSKGFMSSLQRMWRDGGFRGLYAGNAATMAKIVPQTAIQFGTFHSLKDFISSGRKVPGPRIISFPSSLDYIFFSEELKKSLY